MHQKWKEMTGEFSKKSKTNRKNVREIWKNLRHFLEKLQRFSRNLLRFFFGMRGMKVVKAKSAKSQGRRARHTRVRKNLNEGGQNGTKATFRFIRKSSCPTLLNSVSI